MKELAFQIEAEEEGSRADVFLTSQGLSFSRSYIQKLIRDGCVQVNGKLEKAGIRLKEGDNVTLQIPDDQPIEVEPEDIPLDILYEDDDVLLVNKPKGMVVHPAAGHMEHTLVNALLYHCKESLSGINGVLRPGIVHRIDKDTTGVLAICKNDVAHRNLAEQLSVHSITRKYYAIVHGSMTEEERTITGNIGRHPQDRKKMAVVPDPHGKPAVTHVRVLEHLNGFTYVECTLETGRTHQIRVHMASIGHPILGDTVYGPKKCPVKGLEGQTLHAGVLGFIHPVTGNYLEVEAPLPDYFNKLLQKLR